MEKFARKCSVTGEGMNVGYVFGDGEEYFKHKEDLVEFLKKNVSKAFESDEELLDFCYDSDMYYYTEWEDEEDFQYGVINGELVDLDDL